MFPVSSSYSYTTDTITFNPQTLTYVPATTTTNVLLSSVNGTALPTDMYTWRHPLITYNITYSTVKYNNSGGNSVCVAIFNKIPVGVENGNNGAIWNVPNWISNTTCPNLSSLTSANTYNSQVDNIRTNGITYIENVWNTDTLTAYPLPFDTYNVTVSLVIDDSTTTLTTSRQYQSVSFPFVYDATNCNAGYYCPMTSSTNPPQYETPCPIGKYCPANSLTPTPCPVGNYCSSSSTTSFAPITLDSLGLYANRTNNVNMGYPIIFGPAVSIVLASTPPPPLFTSNATYWYLVSFINGSNTYNYVCQLTGNTYKQNGSVIVIDPQTVSYADYPMPKSYTTDILFTTNKTRYNNLSIFITDCNTKDLSSKLPSLTNINVPMPFGTYNVTVSLVIDDSTTPTSLVTATSTPILFTYGNSATCPPNYGCPAGGFLTYIQPTIYLYTGTIVTYTVPAGITKLNVVVIGSNGVAVNINTNIYGGLGASISATITVTSGQILSILVGGQNGVFGGGIAGTTNTSTSSSGNGGDYSAIILGPIGSTIDTNNILVLAAGGGGASSTRCNNPNTSKTTYYYFSIMGGNGGIINGGNGGDGVNSTNGTGLMTTSGKGGYASTNSLKGTNGGTSSQSFQISSGFQTTFVTSGGGGGGGYYGGYGSSFGAGGGGTSYINTIYTAGNVTPTYTTNPTNTATSGSIQITPMV